MAEPRSKPRVRVASTAAADEPPQLNTTDTARIEITDLDRFGQLPLWSWGRLFQNFRVHWFGNMLSHLGVGHVVVRSQAIWVDPAKCPGFHDAIKVSTRLGRVGRSSFETIIDVFAADAVGPHASDAVARGICVLVAVKDGRAGALGESASKLGDPASNVLHAWIEQTRQLRVSVEALSVTSAAAAYRMPIRIRFSDEDTNFHVNQANYLRFFDDAIVSVLEAPAGEAHALLVECLRQPISGVAIEYSKEASVRDGPYEIVLEPSPPSAVDAVVDGYLVKESVVYCRARFFSRLSAEAGNTTAAKL